jgi:hypothetical protein
MIPHPFFARVRFFRNPGFRLTPGASLEYENNAPQATQLQLFSYQVATNREQMVSAVGFRRQPAAKA